MRELDELLPEPVRSLPPAALERIGRFRKQALAAGLPEADVDRWIGLARPAVELVTGGDGPAAARCGGPLMLPADVPTPADEFTSMGKDYRLEHQLIATVDLAALGAAATDLPLPGDGRLLLFANPDLEPEPSGGAVHVPAGAAAEERPTHLDWEPYEYDSPEHLDAHLRSLGDLRPRPCATLPEHPAEGDALVDLAVHPRADDLIDVWNEMRYDGVSVAFAELRVGGHSSDFDGYGDPVQYAARRHAAVDGEPTDADLRDWVLLAEWHGLPMAFVYWAIRRSDLAARRFDRVAVLMWSNP